MRLREIVPIAAVLALTACSESVPVTDLGRTGAALSDYAASWDGYVEAWQFASGSDRVRVVLDAAGQGTLELGDQPLFAPPTDPNVGYPPGVEWSLPGNLPPIEGFQYPVQEARVEARRLRLDADPNDIVKAWCQMQTPVLDEGIPQQPTYACVPNWGYEQTGTGCAQVNPQTNEHVPVDCVKLGLCMLPGDCECTATGCDVRASSPMQLDAALQGDGNDLAGTLALDPGTRLNVHLTRL